MLYGLCTIPNWRIFKPLLSSFGSFFVHMLHQPYRLKGKYYIGNSQLQQNFMCYFATLFVLIPTSIYFKNQNICCKVEWYRLWDMFVFLQLPPNMWEMFCFNSKISIISRYMTRIIFILVIIFIFMKQTFNHSYSGKKNIWNIHWRAKETGIGMHIQTQRYVNTQYGAVVGNAYIRP
jgi:hypothetical protein